MCPQLLAKRVEERTAAEFVVKGVPVKSGQRGQVVLVLLAGRQELQGAAAGECPVPQRDREAVDPRVPRDRRVRLSGLHGVPLVIPDQVDDALRVV